MVFTSFNFILFFPVLVILFWITPSRFRWITLLIASYLFYLNIKPVYALLLASITISTYIFTNLIDRTKDEIIKKKFMIINIILVLLPLFFYKYFADINHSIGSVLVLLNLKIPLPEIKLFLPIGISFYTFMAIGYTIDVYNEEVESEKNFGIVALFISFFPLILSGPIERAKNIIPQFKNARGLEYNMISEGFKFMVWGYFMKLVVADRIGIYVDAIYGNIPKHNGTTLLFTSFLYPFQVYADLGGYSLIAIGTARMLGINVMQNFNRPFFAATMSEFWRRWHISLISWLTDYVYTPLAFTYRKIGIWGIVTALMITFIISGFWHGASLTFMIWGIMQGIFLSIEALTSKRRANFESRFKLLDKTLYKLAGITMTFILFAASQIFGRSENLTDALLFYKRLMCTAGIPFLGNPSTIIYIAAGLSILLIKDYADEFNPCKVSLLNSKHKAIRVLSYCSIIILVLLIGVFDGGQFIYFQF